MTVTVAARSFNWLDISFFGIIMLSALISLFRGFAKEMISLITWLLAAWLGFFYAPKLAQAFHSYLQNNSLRLVLAFIVIFAAVLIIGALVNILLSRLITTVGLAGLDRVIGVIFGLLRGIVLVAILVMLANLTDLPKEAAWQKAYTMPYFQQLAKTIESMLPKRVQQELKADIKNSEKPVPVEKNK